MLVQCDYTPNSGPLRVRRLLPGEADELLSRRVAFYNFWKPLRRRVEERPLAMCDVEWSGDRDFVTRALRYRDRDGEIYVMRHSPRHERWHFPKIVRAFLAMEVRSGIASATLRRRFAGAVLWLDALHRGPGFDQRSIDREVIVRQKLIHLGLRQHRRKELRDVAFQQPVAVLREHRMAPGLQLTVVSRR
jgi:hypothetical protein